VSGRTESDQGNGKGKGEGTALTKSGKHSKWVCWKKTFVLEQTAAANPKEKTSHTHRKRNNQQRGGVKKVGRRSRAPWEKEKFMGEKRGLKSGARPKAPQVGFMNLEKVNHFESQKNRSLRPHDNSKRPSVRVKERLKK